MRLTKENDVNLLNKVHDAIKKIHRYSPAESLATITKCKPYLMLIFYRSRETNSSE
jgi:hypothetical protein